MRLAFVDLFFSWPPHGGADADLYHTASALHASGHDVHVFVASCDTSWERGTLDPAQLPFPCTRIVFEAREVNRRAMPERIRRAVEAWKPEVVFLCDGFFLKPHVAEALEGFPVIARYYAYEVACPRDFKVFKNGAPCPLNYLETPNACRRCALEGMAGEIKSWRFLSWTEEYLKARAFMPGYYDLLVRTLRNFRAIVVYNAIQKRHLETVHDHVVVIPGGVNVNDFAYVPPVERGAGRKVILMTGRVEDPAKGLRTLLEAGDRLGRTRSDFEIRATHTDLLLSNDWFQAIGWHSHTEIANLYRDADVCVFPSEWEEPFGIVAVEAMASGRPVCASRTGGLQGIVEDGATGFLFDRNDAAALAERIAQLLDDAALRRRMGEAARRRAETEYDWIRIVEKHYPPLLEFAVR